jgi:hypothetical protein
MYRPALLPRSAATTRNYSSLHGVSLDSPVSGSIDADIRHRIRLMQEERHKLQQKASKMRQRVSSRSSNLTTLLTSLGLRQNARIPPTVDVLRKTLQTLESRKAAAEQTLSQLLASDEFSQWRELEADLITAYEEYRRLQDCFEEVGEYQDVVLNDLSIARSRVYDDLGSDITTMKRDIATMEQKFSDSQVGKRESTGDVETDPEDLRRRITQIRSTLAAEKCSAAKAIEMEKASALELRDLESAAIIRLSRAMGQQLV